MRKCVGEIVRFVTVSAAPSGAESEEGEWY